MFVSAPGGFVTPLYQALRFEGPRLSSSARLRNRAEVAAPPQTPLYADIFTLKSVHTWSRELVQAHRRTSGPQTRPAKVPGHVPNGPLTGRTLPGDRAGPQHSGIAPKAWPMTQGGFATKQTGVHP